jgi:hypothetical protein
MCSERLVRVERFEDCVHDPCAGSGTIPEAARQAGLRATATDLIDRTWACVTVVALFDTDKTVANIVCNPLSDRRLNAARWLSATPLGRIWLLTPCCPGTS